MANLKQELSIKVRAKEWEDILRLLKLNFKDSTASYTADLFAIHFLALFNLGQLDKAFELIEVGLSVYPDSSNLWRHKGVLIQKKGGDHAEIIKCFEKAVERKPEVAAYHGLLAKQYFAVMDYRSAVANFQNALAIEPENRSFLISNARSLIKINQRTQAVPLFERALKIKHDVITQAILNELKRQIESGINLVSSEYYDEIFANVERFQKENENSIYLPVWEGVVKILKEQNARSVVDIGCGPGQFAQFFSQKQLDVNYQGVDFSNTAIQYAKEKCPQYSFISGSVLDFDYASLEDFDTVICLEMLEHVEFDLEVIENLSPGKKTVFSVPNYDSFGHLRVFKTESEVVSRYGELISNIRVERIDVSEKSAIWLFSGKIR